MWNIFWIHICIRILWDICAFYDADKRVVSDGRLFIGRFYWILVEIIHF